MKLKQITNSLVRYSDFRGLFPLLAIILISTLSYIFFPIALKIFTLVMVVIAIIDVMIIDTFKKRARFNFLGILSAIIASTIFVGLPIGFFFYDFVGLILLVGITTFIFINHTLHFIKRRRKALVRIKVSRGLQPA